MLKNKLLFFILLLLISFVSADLESNEIDKEIIEKEIIKDETIIYTFDSKLVEKDGIGNLIIGKEWYADENGTLMKNLSSLKSCQFCDNIKLEIQEDKDYPIEVVDYNLTHILFNVINSEKNQDGLVKIEILDKSNITNKLVETTSSKFSKDIEEKKLILSELGFDKILKIGDNSTTVYLNNTNNGLITDITAFKSSPQTWASQLRFNITRIPLPYLAKIDKATLHGYVDWISGTIINNYTISRINNQTWTETSIDVAGFNNMPRNNISINQQLVPYPDTTDRWYSLDIKKQIEAEHNESNSYLTLRIEDSANNILDSTHLWKSDALYVGTSTKQISFQNQEYTNPMYINVTYSYKIQHFKIESNPYFVQYASFNSVFGSQNFQLRINISNLTQIYEDVNFTKINLCVYPSSITGTLGTSARIKRILNQTWTRANTGTTQYNSQSYDTLTTVSFEPVTSKFNCLDIKEQVLKELNESNKFASIQINRFSSDFTTATGVQSNMRYGLNSVNYAIFYEPTWGVSSVRPFLNISYLPLEPDPPTPPTINCTIIQGINNYINCAGNCVYSESINYDNTNVSFSGSGSITFNDDFFVNKIYYGAGCIYKRKHGTKVGGII